MYSIEQLNTRTRRTRRALIILGMLALTFTAQGVSAHGVELYHEAHTASKITARYDSGEPLAGAQVSVFAPGSPAEPWLIGTCDNAGTFIFTPDPDKPGLWEVQVRLAGHGGLIRISVDERAVGPAGTTGFTALQKLFMTLAIIWGMVGTALFFSRRQS